MAPALLRRCLTGAWLLCTASAWAQTPASLEDCQAPRWETTLQAPAAPDPAEARAVWMTDRLIRWPGAPADGRYRLHTAAGPALQVRDGAAVQGSERSLELKPTAESLPARQAERFRYLGPGLDLSLDPADVPRVPALLQGTLVLAREDEAGRVLEATRVQVAGALDSLYAAAEQRDLGAQTQGRGVSSASPAGQTRFRLWAPTARQVALCLYSSPSGPASAVLALQRDDPTGSWHLDQPAYLHGVAYRYLVDVWVPGRGLVRNRVTDPYALGLTPDSERSVVLDLDAADTQPRGWSSTPRPRRVQAMTDLIIYELHVRDFSIGDARVPASRRGRYAAFAEPASHGVQHLRRLAQAGLTDVHLLPVFDLTTVPERGCLQPTVPDAAADSEAQQAALEAFRSRDCYNWGYDPLHFTAPEGSFASEGATAAQRVREFRQMVQALHRLGLRVGMDVVYNHTSASGQHPQSVLDRIVPGYYHRLDARGQVERSTCCDNTATEHRMMAKLMIDSAVVWARDYRIDSFRFDLMGHQPRAAMEQLQVAVNRASGRHIHLIGEGWNFGEVADGRRFVQASQLSLNGSGIATFNDRLRDAARGGGAGDNGVDQVLRQGWASGLWLDPNALTQGRATRADLMRSADLLRVGLAGSIRGYRMPTAGGETQALERIDYAGQPAGYVSEPGEVVNYVENHDNQTLFDALVFKLPVTTSREERARAQVVAQSLVLLSQGVAYLHAGQELLRSKSMDRNSYDSGDWFNRIDWTARDNFFGTGLPPRQDNDSSWPWMRPLLANPAIKPRPEDIAWTRDAVLDLLRIRSSTTLLRMRTAADIQARLRFPNAGADQEPAVLAVHIDGRGYPGARFREVLALVNASPESRTLTLDELKGRAFRPHPVHRASRAADRRAAQSRFDSSTGAVTVPGRTAVVHVLP